MAQVQPEPQASPRVKCDGGAVVATVVERVEVPAPATAPDIQGLAAMLTPEQKALLLAELQK